MILSTQSNLEKKTQFICRLIYHLTFKQVLDYPCDISCDLPFTSTKVIFLKQTENLPEKRTHFVSPFRISPNYQLTETKK
jgi:hypothetical protein